MLFRVEISDNEREKMPWLEQDATLVALDYDNYAVLHTCEKRYMGLWTKETLVLLTRQVEFDRTLIVEKATADMLNKQSSQIYTVLPSVINEPGYCNGVYCFFSFILFFFYFSKMTNFKLVYYQVQNQSMPNNTAIPTTQTTLASNRTTVSTTNQTSNATTSSSSSPSTIQLTSLSNNSSVPTNQSVASIFSTLIINSPTPSSNTTVPAANATLGGMTTTTSANLTDNVNTASDSSAISSTSANIDEQLTTMAANSTGSNSSGVDEPLEEQPLRNTIVLSAPDNYVLSWSHNLTDIVFEVRAKARGWLGFGLSTNGDMFYSDVVIAWLNPDATFNFTDRHIGNNRSVLIDREQNWRPLVVRAEDGGYLRAKFMRKIRLAVESNGEDVDVAAGAPFVIFAWGDNFRNDDLRYHGPNNRSQRAVNLIESTPSGSNLEQDEEAFDFRTEVSLLIFFSGFCCY
jgi:hypothetical protein